MATKKGAKFSPSEDLILSKAFVAASEDGTVGTDQKGTEFKLKMFQLYCTLLNEHNQEFGTHYQYRMGHSNYLRFKKISKYTLKYIGVEEASGEPPSGDTERIEWLKQVKETFLKRYPEAKNILENVLYCKPFLQDCPKWRSYEDNNLEEKEGNNKTTSRPAGSKHQKQYKADMELVKKITGKGADEKNKDKQVQNHRKAQKQFMNQVGGGMSAFAVALSEQHDAKLLQYMTPRTRNKMAKKMFELKMRKMMDADNSTFPQQQDDDDEIEEFEPLVTVHPRDRREGMIEDEEIVDEIQDEEEENSPAEEEEEEDDNACDEDDACESPDDSPGDN
jgi:hypothetical protein